MIKTVEGKFPIFSAIGVLIAAFFLIGAITGMAVVMSSPPQPEKPSSAADSKLTRSIQALEQDVSSLAPMAAAMQAAIGIVIALVGVGIDIALGNLKLQGAASPPKEVKK